MSGFIDVNTALSEIMAMGSQFKVRAEEFRAGADPTKQRIIELVCDPSTYGDDRAGDMMRAQHPDAAAITAVYDNHKSIAESAAHIGDSVQTVMRLYEGSEQENEKTIGDVEA